MRRLILAALLALAACTPASGPAPMTSMADFAPTRLSGAWHEVAAIGRPPGAIWRIAQTDEGALAVSTSRDGAGEGRMIGPGRFTLTNFATPLWVLWADADNRTLVLGTPDRSLAMVLDRSARISADRLKAARDILAWNGYDPKALR